MTTFADNVATRKPVITILLVNISCCVLIAAQLYEGSECELKDGSFGTCKENTKCQWLIDSINRKQLNYRDIVRCSFKDSSEIVCCADERPNGSHTTESNIPNIDDPDDIYFGPRATTRRTVPTFPTLPSSFKPNQIHATILPTIVSQTPQPITKPTVSAMLTTPTTQRARNVNFGTTEKTVNLQQTTTRKSTTTVHPFWEMWSPTRNASNKTEEQYQINDDLLSIFIINDTTHENLSFVRPGSGIASLDKNQFQDPWAGLGINFGSEGGGSNRTVSNGSGLSLKNNSIISGDGTFFGDGASMNPSTARPTPTSPTVTTPSTTRSTTTVAPVVTPFPGRLGGRKSESACVNYTQLASPLLSWNILGGSPTSLGEFPHMAALGFPSEDRTGIEFNCGGTVISETFVLTAAHCITSRSRPTIVRLGKITLLTNDDGADAIDRDIAEIIRHPAYHSTTKQDDIALLRLALPIEFNDNVRPACLRSVLADLDPNTELFVTGWGSTQAERSSRSDILLKTNVTAVTLPSCNTTLLEYNKQANQRSLRNGLNMGQMCAHDPQAKNDACVGDSGGPIQIYSQDGVSTVVGVTSFGISCGTSLPSVYTRVAYYLDWLEPIVWPN